MGGRRPQIGTVAPRHVLRARHWDQAQPPAPQIILHSPFLHFQDHRTVSNLNSQRMSEITERVRKSESACVCVHASRYMQVSRGRQALQVWRTQNLQESNKHKFRRCVRERTRIERGKVYKKTHTQPGLGRAGIGCTPGLHAEPKPYQTAMSTKSNQMRDLIKTSVL